MEYAFFVTVDLAAYDSRVRVRGASLLQSGIADAAPAILPSELQEAIQAAHDAIDDAIAAPAPPVQVGAHCGGYGLGHISVNHELQPGDEALFTGTIVNVSDPSYNGTIAEHAQSFDRREGFWIDQFIHETLHCWMGKIFAKKGLAPPTHFSEPILKVATVFFCFVFQTLLTYNL